MPSERDEPKPELIANEDNATIVLYEQDVQLSHIRIMDDGQLYIFFFQQDLMDELFEAGVPFETHESADAMVIDCYTQFCLNEMDEWRAELNELPTTEL